MGLFVYLVIIYLHGNHINLKNPQSQNCIVVSLGTLTFVLEMFFSHN